MIENTNRYKFFNEIIIIFVILSSISVYTILPGSITNLMQFISYALLLIIIGLYHVYDNNSYNIKKTFKLGISLLLIGVFLSMIGAKIFHNQDFKITMIAQRSIYFYLLYPALHYLKIPPKRIFKIIFYFALAYFVLYIIQTVLFPRIILNCLVFTDRGTVRIFMPGSAYLVIAFFFIMHHYFKHQNFKYLLLLFPILVIFFMLGSRQVIASIALTSIIYLLFSKRIKSRFLIIALGIIAIIPVFFMMQDIFSGMIEVTEHQSTNIDQNIRVRASVFFLYEFFPNTLSYIIGNGVPSAHSAYGMQINNYMETFGFYQSDIGIIGEYSKFGLLFVLTELILIFKIIFMKMKEDIIPIKYIFLIISLTLFTGGGAFGNADNIVMLCLLFYIIDLSKDDAISLKNIL